MTGDGRAMTQNNLRGKNLRVGIWLALFVILLGAVSLIYAILV
ncbi:MAG: hypothetical protein V3U53_07280 [bacterium]